MCDIVKISFGFEGGIILLIENLHVLIVFLNERSDFLTNPLEFFDADTEAMHFF